jgi:uncharacterized protein with HEPN domain
MDAEIRTWLYNILQSISEIESYFAGKPLRFDEFASDTKTKRAVERNLEIIGEAVNRILKKDPAIDIPDSRKIIDTRNRIIHGYDVVSDDIIWSILVRHLPMLKQQVEQLLQE